MLRPVTVRRPLLVLLATTLLTVGATTATHPATAAATTPRATYRANPCLDVPGLEKVLRTAKCGTLTVPENRATSSKRTIRLPVVVVPAQTATPAPDPIVYMVGGPGGSALPLTQALVDIGLNRDRDLVVMAQRGTAYTEPELTCPSFDQFRQQSVAMPYDAPATARATIAAQAECRTRFLHDGVDLGAYNSTQNASDFEDLRKALHVAEWNVYGVSYGTYLALTYLNLFPHGVRSVTVDSTLTPDATTLGSFWKNAAVGLGNIFDACEADAYCKAQYPNVRQTFLDLVDKFESNPVVATVKPAALPGDPPAPDAQPVTVNVDGGAFANWAAGMSEPAGPRLPQLITQIANGDTDTLAASWAGIAATHAGVYSYGLQDGVICSEWVPYARTGEPAITGHEVFPSFPASVVAQAPQFPAQNGICKQWDVPKGVAKQRKLGGDAPVLFIAGSYDALTSPYYAQQAAQKLPDATTVIVPGVGHFVLPKSECANQIMQSFLAHPKTPDTTCLVGLTVPPFA